ncbi:GldG family protein [Thioalkalicoccus limnaeus]|uniref:GldG family protein n=1 Tax=Thioalkalicoccus limnaeus TaxID=120681 RepID=A0ABV4BBZ0_9GAMM
MSPRQLAWRSRAARLSQSLADLVFVVLLAIAVVLAGWLVARHDQAWDLSGAGLNRLSEESEAVLAQVTGPLRIQVFVDPGRPLARSVARHLAPFRQALPDLILEYRDPRLFPEEARAAGVTRIGEMRVEYQGRGETVTELSEAAVTAAIRQLVGGSLDAPRWIAVIEGHGERSLAGGEGRDLDRFARALRERGYRLRPLDLALEGAVPENADLVLLTAPAIAPFPGEVAHLIDYLDRGGRLLWLMDPDQATGLEPLAGYLGIATRPGVIVDVAAEELGLAGPGVAVIADYPDHPLTVGLTRASWMPGALALKTDVGPDWTLETALTTGPNSWNETGPLRGVLTPDAALGEQRGPLPVLLALSRPDPVGGADRQRVVVAGDGDFLSNVHLDAGHHRDLGIRIVHWLTAQDGRVAVARAAPTGPAIDLSTRERLLIGVGALAGAPALFLFVGLVVRWQRGRDDP